MNSFQRVAIVNRGESAMRLINAVREWNAEGRSGRFELRLGAGGQTFDVLSVAQSPDYLIEVDGAVHRISGGEAGLVRAPAPAMVVAIPVGPATGSPRATSWPSWRA